MNAWDQELDALSDDLRARLDRAGFDRARFAALAASLREGDADTRRRTRNVVRGEVRAPSANELLSAPVPGTPRHEELTRCGLDLVKSGKVAFCVMAGGMATRMGGVVKALVPVLDARTFLDLRLAENRSISARAGGPPVPLWLMTSDATDGPIRDALKAANAPPHVVPFLQGLSLRLRPDGTLFRDESGMPSSYATGHGDLPDALVRSGHLDRFVAAGGEIVWIANLDNLGASLDPALLGLFVETQKDVMVEVCEKVAGDRGGIPVHAEGKLQILEEFRLPSTFDAATVRVFNTNTFLVKARALATVAIPWTFFEVEKKVEGTSAIQFERLLQELTAHVSSAYVTVPREGETSRFMPVKDHDELARRRAAIEVVARSRGMLSP